MLAKPLGSLLLLTAIVACTSKSEIHADPVEAIFVVEVAGLERFRIKLVDPDRITEAQDLLTSGAQAPLVGMLANGDGGFNAPYTWHLVPKSVRFTKARRPASDALPSEVEQDLEHWLSELGEYSPWESRIVEREQ